MHPKASGKFQDFCVFRTFGAGVHCGVIETQKSAWEYVLTESRRIWRWRSGDGPKIYSCSELAEHGPDPDTSSVAETVYGLTLSTVLEVIPMSDEAIARLEKSTFTGK